MSSNGTVADPDGDFPDWIEVHNSGDSPVNLHNWGLSDDPERPFRWVFPDVTIEADGFVVIWASNKPGTREGIHADFAISATGESVVLTRPTGEQADSVMPVEIPRDASFGRDGDNAEEWVYFETPTVGEPNGGEATHLLAATVQFSETSRLFASPFELSLSGAGPDEAIHYTTNRSIPNASSPQFMGEPLTISATTQVRARVINAAGARGPVQTHHFMRVAPGLATQRSNLPMVVMDAHGFDDEQMAHEATPTGTPRVPAFFFLFDRDESGISNLEAEPALATLQGLRRRGMSSSWWPKRHYSVQFQDEQDNDASYSVLGMAADSDWVLFPGYRADPPGVRNTVGYELSRAMGRWAPDSRFVEVYMNHDGGTLTANDYVGLYAVIERIKQGPHRLNIENVERWEIPPDGPIDVAASGPWTGGYYFEADRPSADSYEWKTSRSIPTFGPFILTRPKLYDLDGGPYATPTAAGQASRQVAYITKYVQAFENTLVAERSSEFHTVAYRNFIDFDSFVDHLILQVFTNNADGLRLSMYFHKPEDQPLVAGPVWDFDRSMGSYDGRDRYWDRWAPNHGVDPFWELDWWGYLMSDADFEQAFYDRWAELRATVFSDSELTNLIQGIADEIDNDAHGLGSAAQRNIDRWWNSENPWRDGSFQAEINHLIHWTTSRAGWMERRSITGATIPKPPVIEVQVGSTSNDLHAIISEQLGESGGSIYATFDGSDPRASGGSPAVSELNQGAETSVSRTDIIAARIRRNGYWSPLVKQPVSEIVPSEPTPGEPEGLPKHSILYPDNQTAWSLNDLWHWSQTHGFVFVSYYPWAYAIQAAHYSGGWIYLYEPSATESGYYFYHIGEGLWHWSARSIQPYVIPIR